MDSLSIKGLTIATRIGIHEWEQRISQPLILDLTLFSDFDHCDDDINKTIDYDKLCSLVTAYVESASFKLIETVAHAVADLIQKEFGVQQLTVHVSKPHAIKNAQNITVSIVRGEHGKT